MGEGNLCSKMIDHKEEDNPSDRGPHIGPKEANKTSQGYCHDIIYIIFNTIPLFLTHIRKKAYYGKPSC